MLKAVKSFAFDYKKFVLILMIKIDKLKDKGKMLINIIDCKEGNLLAGIPVGDKGILGRLKSGLFRFVDGHFYFGNYVYKIRYDLLFATKKTALNELVVFDKYENLLDI